MSWQRLLDQLSHVGTGAVLVLVTLLFAVVLNRFVRQAIERTHAAGQLSPTMVVRLRLATRWTLVVAFALIVLQQTGVFDQAWAVLSAVAATLAVAFVATWSVLSNITSALIVLLFRPFRVGDDIELVDTDGDVVTQGRVMDLNLMYATLLQDDSAALRIPNNLFLQKLVRVRRGGSAPDPANDARTSFFGSRHEPESVAHPEP